MAAQRPSDGSPIRELQPTEPWFTFSEVNKGIFRILELHVNAFMQANMWLIRGRDHDLLVDTGNGIASLSCALRPFVLRNLVTVATHAHADHVGSLHEFDRVLSHSSVADALETADSDATLAGSDYAIDNLAGLLVGPPRLAGALANAKPHGFDPARFGPKPTRISMRLNEGDTIDLGNRGFRVLHVPGHSPGCVALYDHANKLLVAGDVIYDGPLVDELHHSNKHTYRNSLARLSELDIELVLAGHGEPFSRSRLTFLIAAYLSSM